MSSFYTTLLALIGGLVPALIWLWFWLQEDRKNPEPKVLIFITFITGMICVPIVIPVEKLALGYFSTAITIVIWAAIEELAKFIGAYFVALRNKAMDEPIDALIYMIIIALGFAALENTFFIIKAFSNESLMSSLTTGNFRFIGATLLHILSSASIGGAIVLSFYKTWKKKILYILIGVLLSIAIHGAFNLFLTYSQDKHILTIFSFVWAGIIILILFFEKARRIRRKKKKT